jgi:hypothetical protein
MHFNHLGRTKNSLATSVAVAARKKMQTWVQRAVNAYVFEIDQIKTGD